MISNAEKKLAIITGGEKAKIILKDSNNKEELYSYNENGEKQTHHSKCGIAGHVIQTGEIENLSNGYNFHLFNGQIDIETSLPLVCAPIRHLETNKILGCFQSINVKGLHGLALNQKPTLSPYDLETLEFFSKQFAQAFLSLSTSM